MASAGPPVANETDMEMRNGADAVTVVLDNGEAAAEFLKLMAGKKKPKNSTFRQQNMLLE